MKSKPPPNSPSWHSWDAQRDPHVHFGIISGSKKTSKMETKIEKNCTGETRVINFTDDYQNCLEMNVSVTMDDHDDDE